MVAINGTLPLEAGGDYDILRFHINLLSALSLSMFKISDFWPFVLRLE